MPVNGSRRPPEPNFWIAPPLSLPTDGRHEPHQLGSSLRSAAGVHALVRDQRQSRPDAAFARRPARAPGTYTLKLNVDGKSYTQPVTVKNDPRSSAKTSDVRAQSDLLMKYYEGSKES